MEIELLAHQCGCAPGRAAYPQLWVRLSGDSIDAHFLAPEGPPRIAQDFSPGSGGPDISSKPPHAGDRNTVLRASPSPPCGGLGVAKSGGLIPRAESPGLLSSALCRASSPIIHSSNFRTVLQNWVGMSGNACHAE